MVNRLTNFYNGKNVLITGHTGFKGSWLSIWLMKMGATVHGLALAPKSDNDHFVLTGLADKMDSHIGDIRDAAFVNKVMDDVKPEIVFHMAAQPLVIKSYQDPTETFETNFNGALNLLEAIRNSDYVKTLVFITSDKCYKNKEWTWGYRETDEMGDNDPYSASKACAELLFRSYNQSFLIKKGIAAGTTRAGNVIGGGDWSDNRLVPDIVKALQENKPLIIRSPQATRPWQFVMEPLRGYLQLGMELFKEPSKFNGNWNFGPPIENNVTVGELITEGLKIWGNSNHKIELIPNPDFHESNLLFLNCDKAHNILKWKPALNFSQTLDFTFGWYKQWTEGADVWQLTQQQIEKYETTF